jgi:hypothetical protein
MTRSLFGWFGFTSRAIIFACGTSSDSSSKRLEFSSVAMLLKPVRFPPGNARLATRPDPRVADASEDDRDCRGCTFRRLCRNGAWGQDNVDFAADEVGGQSRKPVIVPLRRTIFHRQVFSLNGARLA